MPICADVKDVIEKLNRKLSSSKLFNNIEWFEKCKNWKMKYPVVLNKHYMDTNKTNVYCFVKELSNA
jgi:acetolactate synthase-1/2/3 large subunit